MRIMKYAKGSSYILVVTASVWLLSTPTVAAATTIPNGGAFEYAISHDGNLLAICNGDGTASVIRICDLKTGKELRKIEGIKGFPFPEMSFSPNGSLLALHGRFNGNDVILRLFEAESGKELGTEFPRQFAHYAFTPDSNQVALALNGHGQENQIVVVEVTSGKEAYRFEHKAGPRAMTFSPDGKHLACSGGDLWNLETKKSICSLPGDPMRKLVSRPTANCLPAQAKGKSWPG